jgi:hypothetical protein
MKRTLGVALVLGLLVACAPEPEPVVEEAPVPAGPEPGTPEFKIQNAMSAITPLLAGGAAILDWPASEGAEMTELRPGNNGWTCLPDMPDTPTEDPICLDAVALQFFGSLMERSAPRIPEIGLAYMLMGGSDASNTDPFATAPAEGQDWVRTGPHVMIFLPNTNHLQWLPTNPAAGGPFVMWKGTPYAHVMMPVR